MKTLKEQKITVHKKAQEPLKIPSPNEPVNQSSDGRLPS